MILVLELAICAGEPRPFSAVPKSIVHSEHFVDGNVTVAFSVVFLPWPPCRERVGRAGSNRGRWAASSRCQLHPRWICRKPSHLKRRSRNTCVRGHRSPPRIGALAGQADQSEGEPGGFFPVLALLRSVPPVIRCRAVRHRLPMSLAAPLCSGPGPFCTLLVEGGLIVRLSFGIAVDRLLLRRW